MTSESIHDLLYNRKDYSSFANSDEIISTDIRLDWQLDFDKKTISGSVDHVVKVLVDGVSHVDFDSRKIHLLGDILVNNQKVKYTIAEEHPVLGTKITVEIPTDLRSKESSFSVHIPYSVDPDASAVQWLEPAATKGGKYPYLFTQCQAIHARSLFPCMDSPGVKTPYTARVVAPKWCTVLMSALASQTITDHPDVDTNKFHVCYWTQPVPTSPYLVALAAGNLTSLDISNRVRIWSEPEVIEAAHNEFAETEDFVAAAEAITGCPYQWTRYDVVCLPPSFPYGGMENPCLTFATPTLLAGDRSLADVIAHEIAHSWTGNLVTNAVWDHFWLNEGWTVWLERKITSRVKRNNDAGRLSAEIGLVHLHESIEQQEKDSVFTQLVWPLRGDDPDDAFSSIPYEKGFNLLNYLENLVGADHFDAFVKSYIQEFKSKTVTTGDFRDHFMNVVTARLTGDGNSEATSAGAALVNSTQKKNNKKKKSGNNLTTASPTTPEVNEANQALLAKLNELDWNELFLSKGFPSYNIDFKNGLSLAAKVLARHWIEIAKETNNKKFTPTKSDMLGWSSQQICLFLDQVLEYAMEQTFPVKVLEKMGDLYGFNKTKNAEICLRWQSLGLKSNAPWIVPQVTAFITSQGRMKFVRPLYRLFRSSQVGGQLANEVFEQNKLMYHPIARKMLETDLRKLNELERQQKAAEIAEATTPDVDNASQSTVFVELNDVSVEPEVDNSVTVDETIKKKDSTPKEPVIQETTPKKEVEEPKNETVVPIVTPQPPATVPIEKPAEPDPLWEKSQPVQVVIPREDNNTKRSEEKKPAPTRSHTSHESEVSLFQTPFFWLATAGIAVFSIFAFRRFRR